MTYPDKTTCDGCNLHDSQASVESNNHSALTGNESSIAHSTTAASQNGNQFEGLREATVMMVDDEPITIEVLAEFLDEAGYKNFVSTSDPREAMDLLAKERPDVLLLDLMMPYVSGFDILNAMRADEKLRHTPVIVLTSSTDAETKLKALELGATDFLAKPVDSSELALRLRNTLAAKAYQDRLAFYDHLTGLPNRQRFVDHLDWALSQVKRYNRLGALLHINIDQFKKVNEALGPALADELLKEIAKRFEQGVRASDTITRGGKKMGKPSLSRVGGDEFTVLLVEMNRIECAITVSQRLLQTMATPFQIGPHELFITCSIGIAIFPTDGTNQDVLLQNAGVAMHFAKQQGGNAYRFYSSDLNDRSLQFLSLQSDLHKAIHRNELQLYYQPKIETHTGKLIGAEALVRWQHSSKGFIPPDEFIPLAEDTGLIVQIGTWVFAEACRNIKHWQAKGLIAPKVSVNVSGRQFKESGFLDSIQSILVETEIDPHFLNIELTESLLMENASKNILTLHAFKNLGLNLSMDDFGTGYSSLSYLKKFPLDELKIDRTFLSEVDVDGINDSASIVIAIIALAHSLGLRVVAEGVETQEQLAFLKKHNCDECQGYLFSKPLPASQFATLLVNEPKQ